MVYRADVIRKLRTGKVISVHVGYRLQWRGSQCCTLYKLATIKAPSCSHTTCADCSAVVCQR